MLDKFVLYICPRFAIGSLPGHKRKGKITTKKVGEFIELTYDNKTLIEFTISNLEEYLKNEIKLNTMTYDITR